MRPLTLLITALSFALATAAAAEKKPAAKKPFILYATLLEARQVDLADGARWAMDKGDAFPVMMFKEQQTKVVLQLAGTNFMIEAKRVKILPQSEITQTVLDSYRRSVQTYINTRSDQWKERAATP